MKSARNLIKDIDYDEDDKIFTVTLKDYRIVYVDLDWRIDKEGFGVYRFDVEIIEDESDKTTEEEKEIILSHEEIETILDSMNEAAFEIGW